MGYESFGRFPASQFKHAWQSSWDSFFRLQFTHGFPAKLPEWVEAGIQEVCGKQSLTVQLPWECVSGLWTTDHSSFVLAADWRHANMGIFADRALLPVLC